jgi:hypothetical protein
LDVSLLVFILFSGVLLEPPNEKGGFCTSLEQSDRWLSYTVTFFQPRFQKSLNVPGIHEVLHHLIPSCCHNIDVQFHRLFFITASRKKIEPQGRLLGRGVSKLVLPKTTRENNNNP